MKNEVPVYVVAGFLDAGKTTFLKDLLTSEDFCSGERTLLIRCEDGEEEFDEKELEKFNVHMVEFDKPEDVCTARFKELEKEEWPEQVVIEYNGMWQIPQLWEALPGNWPLYQLVVLVHAPTFENYAKNMGSLMMEKLRGADIIVFNRCTPELKEALRKRNLKMVNRRAEIYLEDDSGEGEDYFTGDECPFDLSVPVLELEGDDYGFWFVDVMDHPDRYVGKKVRYKGIVVRSPKLPAKSCAVGRFAMVCCAQDMSFLGMVCKGKGHDAFSTRDWVEITGTVQKEYQAELGEEGPILYIDDIKRCEAPEQEIVGF